MELSKKDRIILFNQYEILKRLDTDNAEQYEIYQDISHIDLSIIMKRSVQRYVKSRIQFQKKYMRY